MTSRRPDRPHRWVRVVALVAGLVGLLGIGWASAAVARPTGTDVSASEAADLARRAVHDDAALAELRGVTEVDGRPVDLRAATAYLGENREERLDALASSFDRGSSAAVTGDPDSARVRANQVLARREYHPVQLPRPLRAPLRWVRDRFRPVGRALDPVRRFFADVIDAILALPGGDFILLGVVLLPVGLLAWWIVLRSNRSTPVRPGGGGSLLVDLDLDPTDLERRAEQAEVDGHHGEAVRLRYEAGLVRLVRADRLVLRPDTTPSRVAEQLAIPALDRLTRTFEQVVYGDRVATRGDSAAARAGWSEVLGVGARR